MVGGAIGEDGPVALGGDSLLDVMSVTVGEVRVVRVVRVVVTPEVVADLVSEGVVAESAGLLGNRDRPAATRKLMSVCRLGK